jgi:dTDP-4-dehydrorhamnose reductase
MTFLLFGANGWIGNQMYTLLQSRNLPVIKAISRADSILEVEKEIQSIPNLTHVMSFIGRTHGIYENTKISTIDYLEKPGKLQDNVNDNLYSPIVLAEVCKNHSIHFTYLGTGCIFEYDNNHTTEQGFTEDSLPNFFGSSYSIVKGYTDRLMHELYNTTTLNARIRMPITDTLNERNFITKITTYKKVCSVSNSMTVLDDMLPILLDCALAGRVGTYNFTNPGVISHNEILGMYKEIVDPTFIWENFTIEEQNNILASKRSNNYLDTTKLEEIISVPDIKTSLKNILVRIKNNKTI